MFHKLLVPVKTEAKPHLGLNALMKIARENNAALIFVCVETVPDVALSGRTAAFILDETHERRDLANSALRYVREHTDGKDIDVSSFMLKGDAVDAVVVAVEAFGCDAIVLARHRKRFSTSLTGNVGDAIIRKSPVPVLIIAADDERRLERDR